MSKPGRSIALSGLKMPLADRSWAARKLAPATEGLFDTLRTWLYSLHLSSTKIYHISSAVLWFVTYLLTNPLLFCQTDLHIRSENKNGSERSNIYLIGIKTSIYRQIPYKRTYYS